MVCFLFNGIQTFVGYLMSKPSLHKNCRGTIKSMAGGRGKGGTHLSQGDQSEIERFRYRSPVHLSLHHGGDI